MALVDYASDEDERPELVNMSDTDGDSDNDKSSLDQGGDEGLQNGNLVEDEDDAPAPTSSLPSPLDAFAEITGPPDFLKHSVADEQRHQRQKRPAATQAILEAKPQLHASAPNSAEAVARVASEITRVVKPHDPPAQDAADLLRVCVQCGVPKTFSGSRMVCPVCRDRPRHDPESEKKRAPKIKDKEKSKRIKGQSSHATWKSETEMQLRQQFD